MCEARVNMVAERKKILSNPFLFSFLAVIRPPPPASKQLLPPR